MIRAVVDTNILIRALIKPQGTVGPVLKRLRKAEYILVYSELLIKELLEKVALPRIRQKYSLDDDAIGDFLALLALRGESIEISRHVKVCRDSKDDFILETALSGNSRIVVTGDEDLLILKKFEEVEIITPRQFLEVLDRK